MILLVVAFAALTFVVVVWLCVACLLFRFALCELDAPNYAMALRVRLKGDFHASF